MCCTAKLSVFSESVNFFFISPCPLLLHGRVRLVLLFSLLVFCTTDGCSTFRQNFMCQISARSTQEHQVVQSRAPVCHVCGLFVVDGRRRKRPFCVHAAEILETIFWLEIRAPPGQMPASHNTKGNVKFAATCGGYHKFLLTNFQISISAKK